MARYDIPAGEYEVGGARFGIVASRFNLAVVDQLLEGALETLHEHGVAEDDIVTVRVPGAFEIPITVQTLASGGDLAIVIALGAVVRGDTPHFEYVAGACTRGVSEVALACSLPVIFGVLTTQDQAQALARVGGSEGHKGREAAHAALEMVTLMSRLKDRHLGRLEGKS